MSQCKEYRGIKTTDDSGNPILELDHEDEVDVRDPKKRAFFTESVKIFLQKEYDQNPYPDNREKETLAEALMMPYEKIENWFKNERAKQWLTGKVKNQ